MNLHKERKLLKHIKLIYIVHVLCSVITLLIDLKAACVISFWKILIENFPQLGTIHKWYEVMISYNSSEMVSALLTIWTFITAILLFYLGKKDELLYGISNWKMVEFFLHAVDKVIILVILFWDLVTIIIGLLLKIPIVLVGLGVLLILISVYVFVFVLKCTDIDVVKFHLKLIVQIEYFKNELNSEGLSNYLVNILRNIDYNKEEELDFLLDLLKDLFKKVDVKFWDGYTIICFIYPRITDSETRKYFIKNLLLLFMESAKNEKENLSSALMPIFVNERENPVALMEGFLTVIEQESIRRIILARSLVFNGFLDIASGTNDRYYICQQLKCLISNEFSEDEKNDASGFAWRVFRETNVNCINLDYINCMLQ